MIASALLSLLLIAAVPEASDRRPPIDECASDASFVAFRDALRAAVARRDREHLLSIVTEATIVDYGGGVGRADFIASWGLDDPVTSPVWRELDDALSLGCARDSDGSYWSPSLAVQLADHDDIFAAAVARPGAVLRAAPDPDSAALASLEWDVLTMAPNGPEDGFVEVALVDGRSGYVRENEVRLLLDYRAVFERIGGRWVLSAFVAGD